jgi:hypothetical protein
MSWDWLLFIVVILFGNFLMIGAQLIAISNSPGVLLCGERAQQNGTSKPFLGITISIIFLSIVAITIAALIISWVRYITEGEMKYLFAWIVGGVAAVYPIWQARKLSNHERVFEPESYLGKGPTHAAIPVALLLTIVATISFIVSPHLLDVIFHWLICAAVIVAIISLIAMIFTFRAIKSDLSEDD